MKDKYNLKLRPYQEKALEAIRQEISISKEYPAAAVLQMATGLGKTVIFSQIPSLLSQNERMLVLAHRDDLLGQAADKLKKWNPGISVGVEGGGQRAGDSQVVVASVQTLGRKGSSWIDNFGPKDFKIMVTDECVTGDTKIKTEIGEVSIADVPTLKCNKVLTYDGSSITMKNITSWKSKGKAPILALKTLNGEVLKCTKDHQIWTNQGWKAAGDLMAGDLIASMPPELRYKSYLKTPQSVCAGVGKKLNPNALHHKVLSSTETENIVNILKGTTNDRKTGILSLPKKKNKLYMELFWGTLQSVTRTSVLQAQEYTETMEENRKLGLRIKQRSSLGLMLNTSSQRTQDSGKIGAAGVVHAYLALLRYMIFLDLNTRIKPSLEIFWILLTLSDWLYGLEMTAPPHVEQQLDFTRKGIPNKKTQLSKIILSKILDLLLLEKLKEGTAISNLERGLQESLQAKSSPCFQNACGINYDILTSITSAGEEDVFDIGVEDTHCFFGNGLLVHNCHHGISSQYTRVFAHFKHSHHFGFTATVDRHDGKGLIQVYNKLLSEYTLIEGIKDRWLVPIRAYRVVSNLKIDEADKRGSEFDQKILGELLDNEERNAVIIDAWKKNDPGETIVFAADVAHSKSLAESFKKEGISAEHVDGYMPLDKRRAVIKAYQEGDIKVLCNAALTLEGFDAPQTKCIIMARPTKSSPLYQQMLGRVTRTFDGSRFPEKPSKDYPKPYGLLLDVVDNSINNSAITVNDIIGIPKKYEPEQSGTGEDGEFLSGEDLLELQQRAKEDMEKELLAFNLTQQVDVDQFIVDIFKQLPSAAARDAEIKWYPGIDGGFFTMVKDKKDKTALIGLKQNLLGQWVLYWNDTPAKETGPWKHLREALKEVRSLLKKKFKDSQMLWSKGAMEYGWGNQPITEKQKSFLNSAKEEGRLPLSIRVEHLNRGEATHLITKLIHQARRY